MPISRGVTQPLLLLGSSGSAGLLALSLAVGCHSSGPETSYGCDALGAQPTQVSVCPRFSEPTQSGVIGSTVLLEISGLAASRSLPGVLYVHNDSDDGARFYAIDSAGRLLAAFLMQPAAAIDFEDIAVGRQAGQSFVYVADAGDNGARDGSAAAREEIQIYRVSEPTQFDPNHVVEYSLQAERYRLRYPSAPRDAETLLFDPLRSELLLVTKEDTGPAAIFRVPATATLDSPATLEKVGETWLGACNGTRTGLATGGDVSPDGLNIVLVSYGLVSIWKRASHESVAEALGRPATYSAPFSPPNPEAIGFAPDGKSWLVTLEGPNPAIYQAQLSCE